jgi:hypothetical protein
VSLAKWAKELFSNSTSAPQVDCDALHQDMIDWTATTRVSSVIAPLVLIVAIYGIAQRFLYQADTDSSAERIPITSRPPSNFRGRVKKICDFLTSNPLQIAYVVTSIGCLCYSIFGAHLANSAAYHLGACEKACGSQEFIYDVSANLYTLAELFQPATAYALIASRIYKKRTEAALPVVAQVSDEESRL